MCNAFAGRSRIGGGQSVRTPLPTLQLRHDLNLILRSAPQRASRRMGRGPHGSRRPFHGLLTMRVSLALRSNFARRANHFVFSELACPAPFAKIFPFSADPNQMHIHHRLVPIRGAIARRHERGAGCGGRESVRRAMAVAGRDEPRERSAGVQDDRRLSGLRSRVVLAPVAGVKFAEARRPDRALDKPLIRR
jgi:hypothetical protein